MNAAERLLRLFDFNAWSNQKVLDTITEYDDFERYEKVVSLFCHVLAAEELWYRRIVGSDVSGFVVWPDYTPSEAEQMNNRSPGRWKSLISDNADKLDRIISYKNTSGTAYDTMLSDILHHLVIHGQHHRAQIASLLRESGITPPPTDFIFYTRST